MKDIMDAGKETPYRENGMGNTLNMELKHPLHHQDRLCHPVATAVRETSKLLARAGGGG